MRVHRATKNSVPEKDHIVNINNRFQISSFDPENMTWNDFPRKYGDLPKDFFKMDAM